MSESKFKCECSPENAPKFLKWIRERGGVAVWKSVNLSNPGASWCSPATIALKDLQDSSRKEELLKELGDENAVVGYPKPNWQCESTPSLVVTDAGDIGVYTDALYKAFPVGLKRGGGFMCFKLTDGAQRKVDKHMEECREKHGDAFYRRGVLDIDGASMGVFYTTGVVSLKEWAEKNPEKVEVEQ